MRNKRLPMQLQFFAEGETDGGQTPATEPTSPTQPTSQTVDYDKIQKMLEGTLSAKEDTALKAYFKQQGLSQEEMTQAITTFKQQKAQQQPDFGAIQTQLRQAKEQAKQATIEKEATLEAIALGMDSKTIPYLIRIADLSKAVDEEGKVNREAIKSAFNQVLEDVPRLKPQTEENRGFQIGGSSGQQQTTEDALKGAFGL